jgi:hypothetical protein
MRGLVRKKRSDDGKEEVEVERCKRGKLQKPNFSFAQDVLARQSCAPG